MGITKAYIVSNSVLKLTLRPICTRMLFCNVGTQGDTLPTESCHPTVTSAASGMRMDSMYYEGPFGKIRLANREKGQNALRQSALATPNPQLVLSCMTRSRELLLERGPCRSFRKGEVVGCAVIALVGMECNPCECNSY